MTLDKTKFYRVINGIGDWVAYAVIDPDRQVPGAMKCFYQVFDDDGNETLDLSNLKVTDVCWSTVIAGNTVIRLGSLTSTGTLLSEFEFDNWLACISSDEEAGLIMTFDDYAKYIKDNTKEDEF